MTITKADVINRGYDAEIVDYAFAKEISKGRNPNGMDIEAIEGQILKFYKKEYTEEKQNLLLSKYSAAPLATAITPYLSGGVTATNVPGLLSASDLNMAVARLVPDYKTDIALITDAHVYGIIAGELKSRFDSRNWNANYPVNLENILKKVLAPGAAGERGLMQLYNEVVSPADYNALNATANGFSNYFADIENSIKGIFNEIMAGNIQPDFEKTDVQNVLNVVLKNFNDARNNFLASQNINNPLGVPDPQRLFSEFKASIGAEVMYWNNVSADFASGNLLAYKDYATNPDRKDLLKEYKSTTNITVINPPSPVVPVVPVGPVVPVVPVGPVAPRAARTALNTIVNNPLNGQGINIYYLDASGNSVDLDYAGGRHSHRTLRFLEDHLLMYSANNGTNSPLEDSGTYDFYLYDPGNNNSTSITISPNLAFLSNNATDILSNISNLAQTSVFNSGTQLNDINELYNIYKTLRNSPIKVQDAAQTIRSLLTVPLTKCSRINRQNLFTNLLQGSLNDFQNYYCFHSEDRMIPSSAILTPRVIGPNGLKNNFIQAINLVNNQWEHKNIGNNTNNPIITSSEHAIMLTLNNVLNTFESMVQYERLGNIITW